MPETWMYTSQGTRARIRGDNRIRPKTRSGDDADRRDRLVVDIVDERLRPGPAASDHGRSGPTPPGRSAAGSGRRIMRSTPARGRPCGDPLLPHGQVGQLVARSSSRDRAEQPLVKRSVVRSRRRGRSNISSPPRAGSSRTGGLVRQSCHEHLAPGVDRSSGVHSVTGMRSVRTGQRTGDLTAGKDWPGRGGSRPSARSSWEARLESDEPSFRRKRKKIAGPGWVSPWSRRLGQVGMAHLEPLEERGPPAGRAEGDPLLWPVSPSTTFAGQPRADEIFVSCVWR
jgi:hypothetical protein